jgi:hypothetical protein
MTLANVAWDLQTYTKGRFILGLGSQIKPHTRSGSRCRGATRPIACAS